MWKDLDLEQMEREENAYTGLRLPKEVEQVVVTVRLKMYNRGLPCGPKVLSNTLASKSQIPVKRRQPNHIKVYHIPPLLIK